MTRPTVLAVALTLLVLAPSCASPSNHEMTLRSTTFSDGGRIPMRASCEGDNRSPAFSWARVPAGAAELALVVADPDATGGVFHHWVVTGIAAKDGSAAEGAIPAGAVQAKGGSENATWIGPCPPAGQSHRYVFTLYPLSRRLGLPDGVALEVALDAIDDARIKGEEAVLEGRYGRDKS